MSLMFGLYFDDVTNRRVPTIVCKLEGRRWTGVRRRRIANLDCWVGKKRVKFPANQPTDGGLRPIFVGCAGVRWRRGRNATLSSDTGRIR